MNAADLQADFEDLTSEEFFGEELTYTHKGVSISINGIVFRNKLALTKQLGAGANSSSPANYVVEVVIPRSDIPAVTEKEDAVLIPLNLGETPEKFRVMSIIAQDAAIYQLGLSK